MTDETSRLAKFKTPGVYVYGCGVDNRDPQRGYRKPVPVQDTEIAKMLNENNISVPTQDLGKER